MNENVLWPLEPHTRAKHAILKAYLDRWFPILGKHYDRINYIDGFAGPGEYAGGENGSPVLAIESALKHVENETLSNKVKINFIYIENDHENEVHLRKKLNGLSIPSQFNIKIYKGQFRECISEILDRLEA